MNVIIEVDIVSAANDQINDAHSWVNGHLEAQGVDPVFNQTSPTYSVLQFDQEHIGKVFGCKYIRRVYAELTLAERPAEQPESGEQSDADSDSPEDEADPDTSSDQ